MLKQGMVRSRLTAMAVFTLVAVAVRVSGLRDTR
jgi:hypothetical protein